MAGDVIAGRYRLIEPLGRGAMSSVWLAEDPELQRQVAVKMLAPTADRARFEREARAVAALSDPHIGGLYDYGSHEGRPFMVLEYLSGGSLEERLKSGQALPDSETRVIANEIATGLGHAHERDLVHRDLKPANVLFDSEGRAKIVDFGIARMGDAGTLTEAGTVLGTAAYISPEQASGLTATPASDVYSFGVILFRMLTGRLPFVADNAMELVRMNRDERAPAVADIRRDAPAGLAWTADAALAKDPAARPPDGDALIAALANDATAETLAATASTSVTRVMQTAQPARRARRSSSVLLPALAVALVLLAGGAALALALTHNGNSSNNNSGPLPSLSVPSVSTAPSTTAQSTTAYSTTARQTTVSTSTTTPTATSTTAPTTTRQTTTHQTTTAPVTTPPPPPPTTSVTTDTTTTATTTDTTTTTTADTTTSP
ncbi:MAG TPA: serine/threonine-protein kinase [Gaiellaceae bacterium]|nr:serine/threonine-protein kinase [Gaiellaceae bacterium]